MTCNIFKPAPMTLREAKEACGYDLEFQGHADARMGIDQALADLKKRRDAWDAAHESQENIAGEGSMFMCGPGLIIPVCACGTAADYLCDFPMGRGKTCDLNLCVRCAFSVGEDRDFCAIHHAEFRKKTGAVRVNPWPPPRSGR